MSKPIAYPGMPGSILAHLMDRMGSAGEISPRHLWQSVAPNNRQAQELYDAEITAAPTSDAALSPTFTRVVRTLLNPKTNLTFRVWGDSYSTIETNMQFPGLIRDGEGVALNQVNDVYQIGAFFDEHDILEQLGALIPASPADGLVPNIFEAHLPIAIAVTLLAVLDLHRGLEFPDAPYSFADINGYIQGQWGLAGFDKFLCFIPALGQSTDPPSQVAVESALGTLSTLAFLDEVSEGFYELGIELLPLVSMTRGELPGLQWQRVQNSDEGTLLTANRIWLYGSDGLILMLAPMTRGSVFISSIKPEDIREFLLEETVEPSSIEPVVLKTPEKPVSKRPENPCLECGVEIDPAVRFCTRCGTATTHEEERTEWKEKKPKQETEKCEKCGAVLDGIQKFCTFCGMKASRNPQEIEIKEQPSCPECDAEITDDLKFCTKCGTKLQRQ